MTSDPKILVTRFYEIVWNAQDCSVAEQILAPEFKFRGSLGPELVGRDDFIDYAKKVHAGLTNYHCEIQKLIADQTSCAARISTSAPNLTFGSSFVTKRYLLLIRPKNEGFKFGSDLACNL